MINRYKTPEIDEIWTLQMQYNLWKKVEIAYLSALIDKNIAPQCDISELENIDISPDEVGEEEKITHHDVIAFLNIFEKKAGRTAQFIHFGLTSSDIVDTATALRLKSSMSIIISELQNTIDILKNQSFKYKNTAMIGRTHGIFAEPTTFGLKLLVFYKTMQRNMQRLIAAKETVSIGKLSGAVGTYSNSELELAEIAMKKLGIAVSHTTTQVIQRDRYAELVTALAILESTIEAIATELRSLQRSDINEVREPFASSQKGSSAMPHKRNPITLERLTGLARLARAYTIPALENIALWHERDISHSSAERIILPDIFHITHYSLKKLNFILSNLVVNEKQMLQNLKKSNNVFFSQTLLLSLIKKGYPRADAYSIVQKIAFKAIDRHSDFLEIAEKELSNTLEFDKIFSLKYLLRNVNKIFLGSGLEF